MPKKRARLMKVIVAVLVIAVVMSLPGQRDVVSAGKASGPENGKPLLYSWGQELEQQLPLLGHRNWVVIADSAYPQQSNPGIETIHTQAQQLEVLKAVLEKLDGAIHVKPVIMIDAELEYVTEEDAPGVEAYRKALKEMLVKS